MSTGFASIRWLQLVGLGCMVYAEIHDTHNKQSSGPRLIVTITIVVVIIAVVVVVERNFSSTNQFEKSNRRRKQNV